ncbi:MAG: hypothetical protein A2Z25_07230 [Planctomycetes bacterium RBG_16_55_9]|nr:MAG: hypothetical protein A2Z25_07230 [Planctomycetes bacterium RBG_16_55_9]
MTVVNRLKKSFLILLVAASSILVIAAIDKHKANAGTADNGEHVLLVGHGIPANDYPKDRLREFFQMSARHHTRQGDNPSQEHPRDKHEHSHDNDDLRYEQLEREIRAWPRTPENDPYKYGTEAIAEHLRRQASRPVWVAYNEFCDPTIERMVDKAVAQGAKRIVAVSTMLVSGGGHSESDIPKSLAAARKQHPDVEIIYAWPYDVEQIAALLANAIGRLDIH